MEDFFAYWEELGFFEDFSTFLTLDYYKIFDLAKVLYTITGEDRDISFEKIIHHEEIPDSLKEKNLAENRLTLEVPIGNNLEIESYKKINELKKILPSELALDDEIFDLKLLRKDLRVLHFYESENESFFSINEAIADNKKTEKTEQKLYILLDNSRSMEKMQRFLLAKAAVVEFLRRKRSAKNKLFFRTFNTEPGELIRLNEPEEIATFIRNILGKTVEGHSTNLQKALLQVAEDLRFEKNMNNAEILIISDGLSPIDAGELRKNLGEIKINFLKVGDENLGGSHPGLGEILKKNDIHLDPLSLDIEKITKAIANNQKNIISAEELRAYSYLTSYTEKNRNALKDLSTVYLELGEINFANLEFDNFKIIKLQKSFQLLKDKFSSDLDLMNKQLLFKKSYFLGEYVESLLLSLNDEFHLELSNLAKENIEFQYFLLKDPLLYKLIFGNDEYKSNLKRVLKSAKKDLLKNNSFKEKIDVPNINQLKIKLKKQESNYQEHLNFFEVMIILWRKIKQFLKNKFKKKK